jgi:hypothetical protein
VTIVPVLQVRSPFSRPVVHSQILITHGKKSQPWLR